MCGCPLQGIIRCKLQGLQRGRPLHISPTLGHIPPTLRCSHPRDLTPSPSRANPNPVSGPRCLKSGPGGGGEGGGGGSGEGGGKEGRGKIWKEGKIAEIRRRAQATYPATQDALTPSPPTFSLCGWGGKPLLSLRCNRVGLFAEAPYYNRGYPQVPTALGGPPM